MWQLTIQKKLFQLCDTLKKEISSDKNSCLKVHSKREVDDLKELEIQTIVIENEETSKAVVNLCYQQ